MADQPSSRRPVRHKNAFNPLMAGLPDDDALFPEDILPELAKRPERPRLYGARAALASHEGALMVAQTAVDDAEAPVIRLARAEDAVRAIEAELVALAAAEAEELRAWAAGGTIVKGGSVPEKGPMPKPQTAKRCAIEDRLAAAQATAKAASSAAQDFQKKLDDARAHYDSITKQKHALLDAALVEEAERLAREYLNFGRRALKAEAGLMGIADALVERQAIGLAERVLKTRHVDHEAVDPEMKRCRAAWKELVDRLARDPSATVQL